MGKRDNEVKLLDDYGDEIVAIGEELAASENKKQLQIKMMQKIEVYEKQLNSFKNEFPNDDETATYESWLCHFKALFKVSSQGFLRRMSKKTNNSAMAIASGLIAKQQEKSAYQEAIQLLDKAIQLYDTASHHFTKADIYNALKQKEDALKELNHIIDNFSDDTLYIEARKMKDEIENPPKKGCFIATAVFDSPYSPEVEILRDFRDKTLLKSQYGRLFVKLYYIISPPIAFIISETKIFKPLLKAYFFRPILSIIRRS